jgi:hypothetical protein
MRQPRSFICAYLFFCLGVFVFAQNRDLCPVVYGIDADGRIFVYTHNGNYRRSLVTIESDLKGGCYNDANPASVSSVTIKTAVGSPKGRLDEVLSLLARNGWARDRVKILANQKLTLP